MRRLIMWIFGWRMFRWGKVKLYQRGALCDQLAIGEALDETKNLRRWCPDQRLSIVVEDGVFVGLYGRKTMTEVTRFSGWLFVKPSATVRIAAQAVTTTKMVDLLREVGRVDKIRD